ncbi:sodium/proline symporter [Limnoraphis robusta Tam1]|uniref:Sodium/proline symporter n=1 Tax=Limnoraphis robusta CCNP1315 TaxID=3110306 RepID=A0ABU5U3E2_9CYAN|nr:sodium/proline symporter [Limnoraphis robusta]MEA5500885.1 sodium/proline symporter [Limnoraphis robusta BA-68 BA1]MEA5521148.1 sodium/proline symporter [Limnoraphis robusta CCNP1315]MEA5537971.1 sodium/proline symporter [Limnoraphis robusta Tam1]MEA5546702.1 sodium/proline symporter [Limnoraphis robusta CCNP1324]
MSTQVIIAICFIAFLLLFAVVGIYSATKKQNNTTDYLLAGRNVNPWLTGLSAFATSHSGGMFISTIGFTYQAGISSVWLLLGWFLGDYLAWFIVHKPLREVSEENQSETIGSFLNNNCKQNRSIAIISALITILFLGAYAAAQLIAGGKALYAVFGWDYSFGIIVGAIIVILYCFSGGIRASIWTDAVQAVVMMFSMLMLLVVSIAACGGMGELWRQLEQTDPALINPVPPNLQFGFGLFLLSWLCAGFGVVGQPHIMVRAMVLDSSKNMALARNIYAVLYIIFSAAAIGIALAARVLIPDLITNGDPELALPQMAMQLLPAVWVGVILAGVFSAVVSTADSQILSCSAALSQDIFPETAHSYKLAKLATLTVTVIVLTIALASDKNMFALGVFAWSALASALGPLLVLRAWKCPVSPAVGVTMMLGGITVAAVWNAVLGLSNSIYEVLPGMAAGLLIYLCCLLLKPKKKSLL